MCSSILGRPGTTLPLRKDDVQLIDLNKDTYCHRSQSLSASYEASAILESIVQALGEDGRLDISSARQFLQILQDWSQALPQELRNQPSMVYRAENESLSRETILGNIHVACTYYFGVIIVTRQFLIHHILLRLQVSVPTDQFNFSRGSTSHSRDGNETEELGKLCTDAATYMAEMCCEASDAGYLLSNMCILK